MKTFEEKWTAWLDGELTGDELAEFEASLPDKTAAEAEKRDAHKLSAFLKDHLQHRAISNADFFNHQLRERIARDTPSAGVVDKPERRSVLWPIGRLAWAGATFLAIFCVCTFFVLREKSPNDQSQYLTQILNARVDPGLSPNGNYTVFGSKEDKVTVLWVEGLQSLPSEYAKQ